MTFNEIKEALQNDITKQFRRESWEPNEFLKYWGTCLPENEPKFLTYLHRYQETGNSTISKKWVSTSEDLNADDWMLIDDENP